MLEIASAESYAGASCPRMWSAARRRLPSLAAPAAITRAATNCDVLANRGSAGKGRSGEPHQKGDAAMAKDHGPSIKNDKQYEGLRKKGMSKERAARIANSPGSSSRGGKSSGSGIRRRSTSQGGTKAQKAAAGRRGGRMSSS
jgi:hypothetical protein